MAYVYRPGYEERFAHPHPGGDECLVIDLAADRFAEILDADRLPVRTAIALNARVALAHRLLFAAELDSLPEAALALLGEIAQCIRDPAQRPRRARISAHARRLTLDAREALADDPTLTLYQLASKLSVSPHHLSRTFSAFTGRGVARHRIELRIRAALDRLSRGEDNLARLAADLGFADHAHLTRTLRRHTGRTPSQLRAIRDSCDK
jgi:AraC-like DNA-binding protein